MTIEIQPDNKQIQQLQPLLGSLSAACRELGIDFYVLGALARDLHLQQIHDIDVPRRTRDVDVAVAIDEWDSYEDLREKLIEEHGFTDEQEKQKVRSPEEVELDLIPFGGVEEAHGRIRFPPDDWPELTGLGLEQARRNTVSMKVGNGPTFQVVSLPALGLLKIIAWNENPQQRAQDAQDFCFVMQHYFDIHLDAIVENHADLFDQEDFRKSVASARAYGREIASLLRASSRLRDCILTILERETTDFYQSSLADAMNAPGCHPEYEQRFSCLEALLSGIRERLA